VNIYSADTLSAADVLDFVQLIDKAGCRSAHISSGLCNPEWFNSLRTCVSKLPTVLLASLRSLHIDHQYLSAQQWSSLLPRVTSPKLEEFFIRGCPTIQALSKFLSRHHHIRVLHFKSRWAMHNRCIKPSGFSHGNVSMPLLSEIDGPPCHVQAVLMCLSHVPDALTITMESDLEMTYTQYVRTVINSVIMSGPHSHLEIHLPTRYFLNHNLELTPKSFSTLGSPEVASLMIFFPSISKTLLLVCSQCSWMLACKLTR
jgi:hypothetical protein